MRPAPAQPARPPALNPPQPNSPADPDVSQTPATNPGDVAPAGASRGGSDPPKAAPDPQTSGAATEEPSTDRRPGPDEPPAVAEPVDRLPPTAQPTPSTAPADPGPPVARKRKAVAARPPIRPTPIPRSSPATDEEIERSIRRGIGYLAMAFDARTARLTGHHSSDVSTNALAVYAILQAGLAVRDERLHPGGELGRRLLDGVREQSFDGVGTETYGRGLRASCLALFNRPDDRATLELDVRGLVEGHKNGAYTYTLVTPPSASSRSQKREANRRQRPPDGPALPSPPPWVPPYDNSNSQFGVLGVWAGADAGIEVPSAYWQQIANHWITCQFDDGTWGYAGADYAGRPRGRGALSPGSPTMTAAALATLFVIRDYKDAARGGKIPVGQVPFSTALETGLAWWEQGDNAITLSNKWWGYSLYGIERVGLASGFKHFGKHDWYPVLARTAIDRQGVEGGWGDIVGTSFTLLFLSRGRHPILMNKLRFDGFWANRPRDVANLARYASRKLERELNWQVVDLKHDWHEWLDAPILSIASHEPIDFHDGHYEKLRQYVRAGGMIYTQADGDSAAFNDWVSGVFVKRLFPQYELQDLPQGHPLYASMFKFKDGRPPTRLRAVRNGSRVLLAHSPRDLAESWQRRQTAEKRDHFELGVNLFAYAAGRRDLRNRLDSPYVPEPGEPPPLGRVAVARVRYAGNWDPEPAAWERYARLFRFRTGTGADVADVAWKDLKPDVAPLAHLTGTARYDPTDAEVRALRGYVEGGGVLLVDDCGGSGAFSVSVADALRKAFPAGPLKPLDPTHPLLRKGAEGTGMAGLADPRVRPFASEQGFRNVLPQILRAGDGAVVVSRLDVTSGLLGTNTWGINGYTSKYAEDLVQNVILWALDGLPGE